MFIVLLYWLCCYCLFLMVCFQLAFVSNNICWLSFKIADEIIVPVPDLLSTFFHNFMFTLIY